MANNKKDYYMLKLLLVSSDKDSFNGFEAAITKYNDVDLIRTDSGKKALTMAAESSLDLVVADENLRDMTGLEFAGRLIAVNPMTNCALTSSLSAEIFHEKSEGLGLMTQLPINPGQEDVQNLLEKLREIKKLTN